MRINAGLSNFLKALINILFLMPLNKSGIYPFYRRRRDFKLAGEIIEPGTHETIFLPTPDLSA